MIRTIHKSLGNTNLRVYLTAGHRNAGLLTGGNDFSRHSWLLQRIAIKVISMVTFVDEDIEPLTMHGFQAKAVLLFKWHWGD
jgi:hypothetical protein